MAFQARVSCSWKTRRLGESRMLPLSLHRRYVPGHTGHRTANVGDTPLSYIGVYPARAGHDYGTSRGRFPLRDRRLKAASPR